MPEYKYKKVVSKTVTMYPDQWEAVMQLAHERHRGKHSPAMQEIVDLYIGAMAEEADDAAD